MQSNSTKPSVLLIGGTGFLGKHLANKFLNSGIPVKIVSRNSCPFPAKTPHLTHYQFDIENDPPWLEITKDIETVFFLYSPNIPRSTKSTLSIDINSIVSIGQSLLDASVKNGVKKICFPSSGGAVYGISSDKILSEKSLTNPISIYGITKLLFEKLLLLYHHHHGLNYLIYRLSNVYGPHQNLDKPQGVISHWLKKIIEGRDIEIWGDGLVRRDYIFINDAIDAIYISSQSEIRNRVFNVGSGRSYHLVDIINILKSNLNLSFNYRHKSSDISDVEDATLNVDLFKSTFNWQPETDLEEGIQLTYNFLTEKF